MFAVTFGNSRNIGVISDLENLYVSLTTVKHICNSQVVGKNEGIYLTSPTYLKIFENMQQV